MFSSRYRERAPRSGTGSRLGDADGHESIDYLLGLGPTAARRV
jgi:glutamate-1-semialdehyde aminotransferase